VGIAPCRCIWERPPAARTARHARRYRVGSLGGFSALSLPEASGGVAWAGTRLSGDTPACGGAIGTGEGGGGGASAGRCRSSGKRKGCATAGTGEQQGAYEG
jgi:hypothetical protein